MATDGVKIIDGDLAHDIHSVFMEMYDAGASLKEIKQVIEQPFYKENEFDYEIFITVYASCLWQIGQLTPDVLNEVDKVISIGAGVKVWNKECNSNTGYKRQRELEKLRNKLNQPNARIRKRRVYKLATNFIFEEGAVLVFQLPNGNYCATILLEIFQNKGRCTYYFITSTYVSSEKPSTEVIKESKVVYRKMPASFDYEIGLDIIAVSTNILRRFSIKLEQIGKVEIKPELKKVGSYGSAQDFESFYHNWENQALYIKNLNRNEISLNKLL